MHSFQVTSDSDLLIVFLACACFNYSRRKSFCPFFWFTVILPYLLLMLFNKPKIKFITTTTYCQSIVFAITGSTLVPCRLQLDLLKIISLHLTYRIAYGTLLHSSNLGLLSIKTLKIAIYVISQQWETTN